MNSRLSSAARHLGEIEFARVNLDMNTGKSKGHARGDPLFVCESAESLVVAHGRRRVSVHTLLDAKGNAGERAI